MRGVVLASAQILASLGAFGAAQGRDLSFAQRVAAQEAIERVYYKHQIGSVLPFEQAVPRAAIEDRVATYLDQSAALEAFWQTPVTREMLSREIDRMAAHTRMPRRLSELFAALGDDPYVVRECLARAVLADRLARSSFGADESIHAAERAEAEALRRDLVRFGVDRFAGDPRRADIELERGAPASVEGEVGPVRSEAGAFVVSVVLERRPATTRIARFTVPKRAFDAWWAERRSGLDRSGVLTVADGSPLPKPADLPSGADPDFGGGSLASLPYVRGCAAKVWNGSVVFAWGGCSDADSGGGRYDPATDTWTPISAANAPSSDENVQASWDGNEVVVRAQDDARSSPRGGRYDLLADRWQPLDPSPQGAVVDASGRSSAQKPGAAPDSFLGTETVPAPIEAPGPTPGGGGPVQRRINPPASPNLVMSTISETPSGIVFPTDKPTESEIFLGAQSGAFGYCNGGGIAGAPCRADADCPGGFCELQVDNTFCLSYNMSCVGQRVDPKEYGFNDVLEATYDASPAPGRQTWIERNWNYMAPSGTFWRPFHFALDVDANSTCVGGTNEGALCAPGDPVGACAGGGTCTGRPPTGGARWVFTPNNKNGNTSLVLRWPWVSVNYRDGTDPYYLYGFSSWMRTSDFDPHSTTGGAQFTTFVDHANDRRGPWINGLSSVIDFNTTHPDGKAGWVNAGVFDARISGSTSLREISALTGVRSEVNLVSTASSQSVGPSYGLFVQFNPTGSGIAGGGFTGVLVNTPAPPGPGTRIGTQVGLRIADQQQLRSGGDVSAIVVSAQSTRGGSQGNLRFDGGAWKSGHIQLAQGHLWRDATARTLRYKNGAPASDADGSAILTGTGSEAHGYVLWGVSTSVNAGYDTGDEVCAASGLTCLDTSERASDDSVGCDVAHTTARWLAFCK